MTGTWPICDWHWGCWGCRCSCCCNCCCCCCCRWSNCSDWSWWCFGQGRGALFLRETSFSTFWNLHDIELREYGQKVYLHNIQQSDQVEQNFTVHVASSLLIIALPLISATISSITPTSTLFSTIPSIPTGPECTIGSFPFHVFLRYISVTSKICCYQKIPKRSNNFSTFQLQVDISYKRDVSYYSLYIHPQEDVFYNKNYVWGERHFSPTKLFLLKLSYQKKDMQKFKQQWIWEKGKILFAKLVVAPEKLTLGKTNCLGTAMEWWANHSSSRATPIVIVLLCPTPRGCQGHTAVLNP